MIATPRLLFLLVERLSVKEIVSQKPLNELIKLVFSLDVSWNYFLPNVTKNILNFLQIIVCIYKTTYLNYVFEETQLTKVLSIMDTNN